MLTNVCVGSAAAQEVWRGSSEITFKGYSTLHDFEGTLKNVPLRAVASPGKNGRTVTATSEVKVREMSTRNAKRDDNMMSMFHEPEYHFIKVEVNGAEESSLRPQNGRPGAMKINLTIAGKQGLVSGAVTDLTEQPGTLAFNLKFPVSLAAFNLAPPKALGGLVKVQDTVDVTAHIVLKKEVR
jgi:hypothetical protein